MDILDAAPLVTNEGEDGAVMGDSDYEIDEEEAERLVRGHPADAANGTQTLQAPAAADDDGDNDGASDAEAAPAASENPAKKQKQQQRKATGTKTRTRKTAVGGDGAAPAATKKPRVRRTERDEQEEAEAVTAMLGTDFMRFVYRDINAVKNHDVLAPNIERVTYPAGEAVRCFSQDLGKAPHDLIPEVAARPKFGAADAQRRIDWIYANLGYAEVRSHAVSYYVFGFCAAPTGVANRTATEYFVSVPKRKLSWYHDTAFKAKDHFAMDSGTATALAHLKTSSGQTFSFPVCDVRFVFESATNQVRLDKKNDNKKQKAAVAAAATGAPDAAAGLSAAADADDATHDGDPFVEEARAFIAAHPDQVFDIGGDGNSEQSALVQRLGSVMTPAMRAATDSTLFLPRDMALPRSRDLADALDIYQLLQCQRQSEAGAAARDALARLSPAERTSLAVLAAEAPTLPLVYALFFAYSQVPMAQQPFRSYLADHNCVLTEANVGAHFKDFRASETEELALKQWQYARSLAYATHRALEAGDGATVTLATAAPFVTFARVIDKVLGAVDIVLPPATAGGGTSPLWCAITGRELRPGDECRVYVGSAGALTPHLPPHKYAVVVRKKMQLPFSAPAPEPEAATLPVTPNPSPRTTKRKGVVVAAGPPDPVEPPPKKRRTAGKTVPPWPLNRLSPAVTLTKKLSFLRGFVGTNALLAANGFEIRGDDAFHALRTICENVDLGDGDTMRLFADVSTTLAGVFREAYDAVRAWHDANLATYSRDVGYILARLIVAAAPPSASRDTAPDDSDADAMDLDDDDDDGRVPRLTLPFRGTAGGGTVPGLLILIDNAQPVEGAESRRPPAGVVFRRFDRCPAGQRTAAVLEQLLIERSVDKFGPDASKRRFHVTVYAAIFAALFGC